jgi:hypothetical protein
MRVRDGWRRLGRLGLRHVLVLGAAALVATGVAASLGLLRSHGVRTAMAPPAAAPPWQAGVAPCRQDPMAGVPQPTRFVVVAGCSTVSGTVRQVRRDPVDGELNLRVEPDQAYTRFLPPGNHGQLRVAAVPRDIPTLTIPTAGQHATFYGAWVLDRNQHRQAAMHPAWMITPTGGGAGPTPASSAGTTTPSTQRLRVRLVAPPTVPVGGAVDVFVRVESASGPARRPEPETNLFVEVRTQDGRGVQWKAATTNAIGKARVTLVALQQPGDFELWLYADKPGRSAVVHAPLTVLRR